MKVTTVYPQETLNKLKAVDDAICTVMKNLIPQELVPDNPPRVVLKRAIAVNAETVKAE